jgi:signal transduction histidine kinase
MAGSQSRGILSQLSERIIGSIPEPFPAPERMRDEFLVQFLLVTLPIIAASSILDIFLGYSPFSWALLVTGLLILLFFRLFQIGMRTAGIDVFFFGSTILLSAGYAGGIALGTEKDFVLPLISVLQFAAIVIYGLYASSRARLRLLFIAVALFDLAEFALLSDHRAVVLVNRIAVLALHSAAYGFGHFLRSYFEQLHRIAEARQVMNQRLQELVSETRASESNRLASFSHDIRSPITGIIGVHEMLSATKLDDEQRRYLDILAKSNRLLLELVESTLDRGSATSEGFHGPVALRAFLDDVLHTV